MIVVTGAAGFIGSCLISGINDQDISAVVAVDDFSRPDKLRNLQRKQLAGIVHRDDFEEWLANNHKGVGAVFHLGARTDTTEFDWDIFDRLNLSYSKTVWKACCKYSIPMIYASSAATYGDGRQGYMDHHDIVENLKPLNPYGVSKNLFDLWALSQKHAPPHWYGLKFFNVYGPNEYHKGRMASVIMHAFNQISATGKMKLFRSHRDDIADGHQSRDFIYVKDILSICLYCLYQRPESGLYNAGTGKARTFLDLVEATFSAMDLDPVIEYIDTPADIRDKYQYFTQADMHKLTNSGFSHSYYELEDGVDEYVRLYLAPGKVEY
ncbi:MAG: ADP-glyceromanno-heptose 6-epimerase [Saprospiraceae bacterium]|nr:ADP-glyceromanno-heptose 6-epimerase [Saprospiraceae bacterium]